MLQGTSPNQTLLPLWFPALLLSSLFLVYLSSLFSPLNPPDERYVLIVVVGVAHDHGILWPPILEVHTRNILLVILI